jgi:cation diffusion facilitator CzcD-associated flavoprotein CzcO
MTYLIIGAGPAGLAAAKTFKQAGLDFVVAERHGDIGGQWLYGAEGSAVYASTHLISSKGTTAFTELPMADDLPAYPRHDQVRGYLHQFAHHFGLYEHIRLNTGVLSLAREGDAWRAAFSDGSTALYEGVVIANGHLSDPNIPSFPGTFSGEIFHSKRYKTPEIFDGKRVLIVGAGNTGCDIVVDAVHRATAVGWSLRGGNHFVPKFVAGRPADAGNHNRRFVLPRNLRSFIHGLAIRILVGPPERFGLPKPRHRLYDRTPIVNSLVLQHLGQGDVRVHKPIERFDGRVVHFKDGVNAEYDLIILATGYRTTFPFLDLKWLNWREPAPHLYLNIFPPGDNGLYVCGLLEGAGIGWPGRMLQAELIAAYIAARAKPAGEAFRRRIDAYCAGPRPRDAGEHGIFVDFLEYKRDARKAIEGLV